MAKFQRQIISMEELEKLPYFVIEELLPNSQVSSNFSGADRLPIAISRIMCIKKVHVVRFSYRGCYIGKNLGRNPHYTVRADQFETHVRQKCFDHHIPIKMYPTNKLVSRSEIIVVFNFGDKATYSASADTLLTDTEFQTLKELIDQLGFDDIECLDSNGHSPLDRIRGPSQVHFGFGSNYNLRRLSKEDGGYVCPRLLRDDVPTAWKERFRVMTALGDNMYTHSLGSCFTGTANTGLFDHPLRNSKFSHIIHPESKIEAITLSQTEYPMGELKIHMDVNNDDTESGVKYNYNFVVCAWQHQVHEDSTITRNAILGYSRRSVGDFLRRSNVCSHYVSKVVRPSVELLPSWRVAPYPKCNIFCDDYFQGEVEVDVNGSKVFPPTMNYQATYLSAFADVLLRFKSKYESHNKVAMTVEKQLECVLPIAFCDNAYPFVRVFEAWMENVEYLDKSKDENITYSFVQFSNHYWKSVRNGGSSRHRGLFPADPTPTWILFALRCLRGALVKSTKSIQYSYKCMVADLRCMSQIGERIAQHLVHLMCLVNLIHPKYGVEGSVCVGNASMGKLRDTYNIARSTLPYLVEYISVEMGYTKHFAASVISNIIEHRGCGFKDSIMANQTKVFWVAMENGEPKLHSIEKCAGNLDHRADIDRVKKLKFVSNLPFAKLILPSADSIPYTTTMALKRWFEVYNKPLLDGWIAADGITIKRKCISEHSVPYKKKIKGIDALTRDILPPTLTRIDWTSMDDKELKEYTRQYNKAVKNQATTKVGDSEFLSQRLSNTLDLRMVHSMGKHFISSRVVSNHSRADHRFKNVTHLQSLGVRVLNIDLYRIAADCCLRDYRKEHPDCTEHLICTVETHQVATTSKQKRTLHSAAACVVSLKKDRPVYRRVFMTAKSHKFTVVGAQCVTAASFEEHTHVPADALLYHSKAAAKEDLLWYIAIRNGHPTRWVSEKCCRQLWTTFSDKITTPNKTEEPGDAYLLLTLQNGPRNCNKGNIFCTLIWEKRSSVSVCFHPSSKKQQIFSLGKVDIIDGHVEDTKDSNCVCDKANVDNTKDSTSVCDKGNKSDMCKKTTAGLCARQEDKSSIPRWTTVRMPMEVDPFGLQNSTEITRQDYASHLLRWSEHWTQVLHLWRSTFVVRRGGLGGDKYWHPPGTSLYVRSIRSSKDLRSYLDFCVGAGGAHYEDYLRQWKDSQVTRKKSKF